MMSSSSRITKRELDLCFEELTNFIATCSEVSNVNTDRAASELKELMSTTSQAHVSFVRSVEDQEDVEPVLDEVYSTLASLKSSARRLLVSFEKSVQTVIPTPAPRTKLAKISFRPLDRSSVSLWFSNLEDLFEAHGVTKQNQNQRFVHLSSLLNQEESMVVHSLSQTDPRPEDIYEKAKQLLVTCYQAPWIKRFPKAMATRRSGMKPSAYLNQFELTVGKFSIDDVTRYIILRDLPASIRSQLSRDSSLTTAAQLAEAADVALSNFEGESSDNLGDVHAIKDGLCVHHQRYKDKAYRCADGCLHFKNFKAQSRKPKANKDSPAPENE